MQVKSEHSVILLTFIKLPFVIKIFVLSIFEWLFYTGFTISMLFRKGIPLIRECLIWSGHWSLPLLFAATKSGFLVILGQKRTPHIKHTLYMGVFHRSLANDLPQFKR